MLVVVAATALVSVEYTLGLINFEATKRSSALTKPCQRIILAPCVVAKMFLSASERQLRGRLLFGFVAVSFLPVGDELICHHRPRS